MMPMRPSPQACWATWLLLYGLLVTSGDVEAVVIEVIEGQCTLADAVRAADTDTAVGGCPAGNGADTIRIVSPDEITLDGSLEITSVMSISSVTGGQVTISGEPSSVPGGFRVFDVIGGELLLRDVKIMDGIITADPGPDTRGGALRAIDSRVVIEGCVFFNNFTSIDLGDERGNGAIYAENSTIEVSDCKFSQNGPPSGAGHGAVIDAQDSTIVFTRVETRGPDSTGADTNIGNRDPLILLFQSTMTVNESGLFQSSDQTKLFWFRDRRLTGEIELQSSVFNVANSTLGTFFPPSVSDSLTPRFEIYGENSLFRVDNSTLDSSVGIRGKPGLGADQDYLIEWRNSIMLGNCWDGVHQWDAVSYAPDETCESPAPTPPLAIGPLQDNGGPTETRALFWNSYAVNNGFTQTCTGMDQRGRPRVDCDLGAYEFLADVDIEVAIVPLTPPPYYAGQTVEMEVLLSNTGPDAANNVRIDISGEKFDIQSVDGACIAAVCGIGTLEPGGFAESGQIARVIGTPTASGQNAFTLTATASPGLGAVYTELDNADNSISYTGSLVAVADLSIDKRLVTPPPYALGREVEYQVTIKNLGPDRATTVVFVEEPQGLDITAIPGCSNPPAGPCQFSALNVGESLDLTVQADITAQRFDNTARVTLDQHDPVPANNVDDRDNRADISAVADTGISIGLDTDGPFFTGQTVEFSVRIGNAGPDTATDVTLDLQTENFFPSAVIGNCMPSGSLPCNIGDLAPNERVDVVLQGFAVSQGTAGILAFVESGQQDPGTTDNVAEEGYSVVESADVSVDLHIHPPSLEYGVGETVTYYGRIGNAGDDYADNVVLDLAPVNLEILGVFSASCSGLTCTVPTLARPAHEDFVINARIVDFGPFDLEASVSADQFDPVPANNVDASGNGGTATIDLRDILFNSSFGS
jgi:hypothetical protein